MNALLICVKQARTSEMRRSMKIIFDIRLFNIKSTRAFHLLIMLQKKKDHLKPL